MFVHKEDQKRVGQKYRKRRPSPLSEYGRELREKQELKAIYNLRERQFKKYIQASMAKRKGGNAHSLLLGKLEARLDNVVFRFGIATTRRQARQFVSHGHILINGKKVDIPSFQVRKDHKISLKPGSKKKVIFKDISKLIAEKDHPLWLKVNAVEVEAEVIGAPIVKESEMPVKMPLIFEFYSR